MPSLNQLRQCFRDAFALPPDAQPDSMEYQKTPVWDSLGHMRLVAGIESAFGIMLEIDQILDMSSFAKAQEIVGKHGVVLEA